MNINVQITRQENADYFGKPIGSVVSVQLEDYIAGVVASEIGNTYLEACKAQAIASRTCAYPYFSKGKAISDSGSKNQAYRACRCDKEKYPNAVNGAKETSGKVLTYNGEVISSCPYTSSNGGTTVSSEERWGSYRPWLISQKDEWDAASGTGKNGHGVGMSQRGAKYAASTGATCKQILSFYYHGTSIGEVAYSSTDDTSASAESNLKGCDGTMIQSEDLIKKFQQALSQKWGYIYGASGETWTQAKQNTATREQTIKWGSKWIGKRVADCSGLFTWAFKELGGYMYHGSNTMFNKYTTSNGTLSNGKRTDGGTLRPGTAVFKYASDTGYHHVGLYIGNNTVIEAKGTFYGVVTSSPSIWSHWGELKGVNYSGSSSGSSSGKTSTESEMEECIMTATVSTSGGTLNLRSGNSTSSNILLKIPNGSEVNVSENNGEWWKVTYNGVTGYAMSKFLSANSDDNDSDEDVHEDVTLSSLDSRLSIVEATLKQIKQKVGG